MPEKDKEQSILNYLDTYGLLLCNENKYLPSLFDIGGDWDSIISLIEKREAFYCKVYKKRTNYISKELYFLLKNYKQSTTGIPAVSLSIYNFLYENGPADTETIKNMLMLNSKSFKEAVDVLFERMLVTAVKRGNTLNQTWSTLVWGTYIDWEKDVQPLFAHEDDYNRLFKILNLNLSEKEITKIIS